MTTCIHHWILEEPHGTEYVAGRCRKCGAERDHPVVLDVDYRAGMVDVAKRKRAKRAAAR